MRVRKPAAASRDMYLDSAGNPIAAPRSTGRWRRAFPASPRRSEVQLARHFGKLPLKMSLQPAIRRAREGFTMYARLPGAIRYKRERLLRSPDASKVFLTAGGEVPELGALIKQRPDLARTLEARWPRRARKGFYGGRVAAAVVNGVRAGGGIWTLQDLAAYRVVERKPLVGDYHGAHIVSASPPSPRAAWPCWMRSISWGLRPEARR